MKLRISILLFAVLLFVGPKPADSQSFKKVIDFEENFGNQNNYPILDYSNNSTDPYNLGGINNFDYWNEYGVRFFAVSPGSQVSPTIAMVGAPLAAFGGPNRTEQSCHTPPITDAQSETDDMPAQNQNVGCYFLTTFDGSGGSPSNLIIEYDTIRNPCSRLAGQLLDIDDTSLRGEEKWSIDVYGGGGLVATVVLCSPNYSDCGNNGTVNCSTIQFHQNQSPPVPLTPTPITGDGIATDFVIDISSTGYNIHYLDFRYTGCNYPGYTRNVGLAFDNFSFCSIPQEGEFCCNGQTLIPNGTFENGNTGFQNDYNYEIPANKVNPGDYSVIDFNNATNSCTYWSLEDHTHCITGNNNHVLVVNGKTQQGGNTNSTIWETDGPITVEEDSTYKFCAFVQHLPQCCFDITPKMRVEIKNGPGSSWTPIFGWTKINLGDKLDDCDWENIGGQFTANGTSVKIRIRLTQTGNGDGNDLALDDVSLIKIPQANIQLASFGVSPPVNLGGGNFTFTALPNPLPDDCSFSWEVCAIDNNNNNQCDNTTRVYNPPQWWNAPYDFAGYNGTSTLVGTNPGEFSFTKEYRITRGVWCECESWNQYSVIVNEKNGAIIFKDSKTGKIISRTELSQLNKRTWK